MHRKMEYIDLFSSTRVLYKLPSYHEGGWFRQSISRTWVAQCSQHSPKKSQIHAAVWCTSRSSVGQRQIHSEKRHNPVLKSHPARKTQGETYRLKSSRLKNRKKKKKHKKTKQNKTTSPTVCIQQSALWIRCFSSNLSYKNIKSTKLTAHHVYEPAKQSERFHWSWVRKQS